MVTKTVKASTRSKRMFIRPRWWEVYKPLVNRKTKPEGSAVRRSALPNSRILRNKPQHLNRSVIPPVPASRGTEAKRSGGICSAPLTPPEFALTNPTLKQNRDPPTLITIPHRPEEPRPQPSGRAAHAPRGSDNKKSPTDDYGAV